MTEVMTLLDTPRSKVQKNIQYATKSNEKAKKVKFLALQTKFPEIPPKQKIVLCGIQSPREIF